MLPAVVENVICRSVERHFSRLSDREKEVLQLFSRGHDAKSAADALGVSVYSIHERLRDARRKLGASSSREAARMLQNLEALGDQESWDNKFDLDRGAVSVANITEVKRQRGQYRIPPLALVGVGVLLSASIAAWLLLAQVAGPVVQRHPTPAPKVVASSPTSASNIRPGSIVLSVTFDRPMLAGAMSFVQVSPETYPDCDGRPMQSQDGRTYSMRCTVQPNRRYEVWFNRAPYMNFRGLDGTSAEPKRLVFTTTGD